MLSHQLLWLLRSHMPALTLEVRRKCHCILRMLPRSKRLGTAGISIATAVKMSTGS